MKKLICICCLLAITLISIKKALAYGNCSLSGTTAQCSISYVPYPGFNESYDNFSPTSGIPISVNVQVYHYEGGHSGWEVNWGTGFWANLENGTRTIPAGDNSGTLWIGLSASSGYGSITATW